LGHEHLGDGLGAVESSFDFFGEDIFSVAR
jgi:hypothetical protein